MSAFFGIIHFDGRPTDRTFITKTCEYIARIGPDAQDTIIANSAGFCWAQLKIRNSAGIDNSPVAYDHRYTVIGDVRLDAREELIRRFPTGERASLKRATDLKLILAAWLKWKHKLSDFLIGDFSFAIWDQRTKSLFCLRDHMGIRPFYFARIGSVLLFSNVLNCIRSHPLLNGELNDLAVLDFLTFGFNLDSNTTIYKHIQALAPAHTLSIDTKDIQSRRYWNLPIDERLHYKNVYDYVDHFRDLLDTAVADRVPAENLSIAMSGGLDSTSIAACARPFISRGSDLNLYTLDIKSLWPEDAELEYASLVARELDAGIHAYRITTDDLFKVDEHAAWCLPEPTRDAFHLPVVSMQRRMSEQSKVGLTGEGADSMLMQTPQHFNQLLNKGQWRRLIQDSFRFYQVFQHRPPLGLRTQLKHKLEHSPWRPTVPAWLKQDMRIKTGFDDRFALATSRALGIEPSFSDNIHPERNPAYQDLLSNLWPTKFRRFDPQTTGIPIEFRHPYFDIRLLQFLLAMPASPWFYNKELLRRSMSGRVPETVRSRKKSMPTISPIHRALTSLSLSERTAHLDKLIAAEPYINLDDFRKLIEYTYGLKSDEADQIALPIRYGIWLQNRTHELD